MSIVFFFYFSIHQKWLLICGQSSKRISHRCSKQVISRSTVEKKKERKKVSLLFFAKLVARSQGKKNSLTSHLLRILKIEKQKNGFSDSQSKIEKSLNCFLFFSKYVSSKTIFPLNNEWKFWENCACYCLSIKRKGFFSFQNDKWDFSFFLLTELWPLKINRWPP